VKRAVKLAVIQLAIIAAFTASAASAQQPDAPSATRAALLTAAVAEIGADAYLTNRNAEARYNREMNPIARVVFNHGTAARAGYFAGCTGLFLLADHKLNRHHHRAALALEVGVVASEFYFVHYSATH